jgi:hypothetical protein
VIEDWYPRLQASGLLDTLAPYEPVLVGAYPLAIAGPDSRIEIVCRAVDLPAFARTMERAYGERDGFVMHPGSLDVESAVFAEFLLDGLPLEVAAQPEHVHRSLGAATLGISRVLEEEGELARTRLEAAVAHGDDWLDAAMAQTGDRVPGHGQAPGGAAGARRAPARAVAEDVRGAGADRLCGAGADRPGDHQTGG